MGVIQDTFECINVMMFRTVRLLRGRNWDKTWKVLLTMTNKGPLR